MDRTTISEWYLHFNRPLKRRLGRWQRLAAADADDVLADLWCKLLRVANDETVGDPCAYLSRAAINMTYEWRSRARQCKPHFSLTDFQTSEAGGMGNAHMPLALVLELDDVALLMAPRIVLDVRTALNRLTPRQRQCVMLHYDEGKTYAEIAVLTGMTPRTVQRQLLAARRDLRSRLRKYRADLEVGHGCGH